MTARFVHLHVHSEYSLIDSTIRIGSLVSACAKADMPALALTDQSNLFALVKFYKDAEKAGLKPIAGADLWIANPADRNKPTRLTLLCRNRAGYLNLSRLLSRAYIEGQHGDYAQVDPAWLQGQSDGLIALFGRDSDLGHLLLAGNAELAAARCGQWLDLFGDGLYLEICRIGQPQEGAFNDAALRLAARLDIPVVASNDVRFLLKEDFAAHEARVCIHQGRVLADPKRPRDYTAEQYLKSPQQMAELFADLPEALRNSVEIAKRCTLELSFGTYYLPAFPVPPEHTLDTFIREQARKGLAARLAKHGPAEGRSRQDYEERLEIEVDVIVKMGFPGYFLIVSDFIVWAKEHGCPVGPGRGSGAGSLVAYALFITDLDPLRYQLLFERFLNPERVSMPDFDIDFCQANRDRVIDYVKDKYGRDAVSQIATFGTMAAKAALRDVGRVLGMGYGHVDGIAKLIPAPPGKTVTLARVPDKPDPGVIYARREAPELEQREAAEEEVAELLSLAMRVEGIVRNVGMHAGGVLIAPGKITDFCPLYQQPGSDSAVSQFDKDDVEAIGLVKFDFLGLATLTILELAKEFIVRRRPERRDFSYEALPLDDPKVYKLFTDGLTEAVFQFESRGMQGMLREARPNRLEDLIAMNAMFRPGPMENIPSFCARKNGKEDVSYPHPLLATVLDETYGIFVYQEQVMQAAQILGDYSLGGADLLRRAMGKKKAEEMAEHRAIFREGASKQGIAPEKADEVFDLMEKFAGYGFNKSHAAAYALLAYHTAWLKVHCTAEFYAANMTIEADNTDKLRVLLADAKLFGIAFDPPDVNQGTLRFEPVGDRRVRYGLGAIKGTGAGAIEAIVAAREGRDGEGGGPFRSLFDFCARVDRQRVNKRVVEALVKAGAFDALHPDRASALAGVGLAFDWADTQAAHADQGGLFDFGDAHGSSTQEPALPGVEPWTIRERLTHEKAAIGFYLSGHLFDACRDEVRRFARRAIADLVDTREPVLLAGIVSELRVVNGQRGRVAIFKLEDGSEVIESVANDELIDAHRDLLRDDELVIVQGRLQPDRFSSGLRLNVNQLWDLPAARARFGRYLAVDINGAMPPVAEVLRLWPVRRVESDQGELVQGLGVRLRLRRRAAIAELDLGDDARFWPSDEALARWKSLAEGGVASIVYE